MTAPSRRAVLATLVAATAGPGCLHNTTDSRERFRIELFNLAGDGEKPLDVLVETDDEILAWSTVTVSDDEQQAQRTLSAAELDLDATVSGPLTIRGRVGDEFDTTTLERDQLEWVGERQTAETHVNIRLNAVDDLVVYHSE